jgi:hypothetical protein
MLMIDPVELYPLGSEMLLFEKVIAGDIAVALTLIKL